MEITKFIFTIIISYLIGSIPFAVLVARCYGVNIFKEGSGNAGATNIKRVLGSKAGILVFSLDFLKGFVAAGWPLLIWRQDPSIELLTIVGLISAIVGHSYSIFLKFKGGKGISTAIGGLAIIMPINLIIGIICWVGTFCITRYVSVASFVFVLSLPITAYFLEQSKAHLYFAILLVVIILITHRINIIRLIRGEEYRFDPKKKK